VYVRWIWGGDHNLRWGSQSEVGITIWGGNHNLRWESQSEVGITIWGGDHNLRWGSQSEVGITIPLSKVTYADLREERCINMRWPPPPDRYLQNCCSKPTRGKENRWRRIGLFPYLITYAWLVCQMLFAYDGGLCWHSTANRIAYLPSPRAWYWILLAGNVFSFQTHSQNCEKWLLASSCLYARPSVCLSA
jgi:hypothetical protein